MGKYQLSLHWKFFLVIALVVFPTLAIIFKVADIQYEKQVMDQVRDQARTLAMQVIMTRQWVADCGGVMVLSESKGAKGTNYFYDDRMETSRGVYQRFTPSMVTKKLSQYSFNQNLYRFRLASLNPLNPENSPDVFEKNALGRFENEGLIEISRIDAQGNSEYFQYTVPLYMEKACLDCHKRHDLTKKVGGGLSVFLPIDEIKSSLGRDHLKLAAPGIILILLTIFTLLFLLRRVVVTPLKKLESMAAEISEGKLEARVDLSTGDELEKLGHTFNFMAERLSEGRDFLEERIKQATHELTEANRELQTLDKMKSDFLAIISHELRTPLTAIRGGADYLNRTIKESKNRSYLAIIDKNLTRLIRLVSELFDFTRIEAHKLEWSFERVNLSSLVQEVIEIISPLATERNITIKSKYPIDIYADMDLERIEQVLVNLIENGMKFSGEGTELQVTVEDDPDTVLVSVKDHGMGISKENLEKIFEKFTTLPSSDGTEKTERTGLGLAISKGIIEAHGGKIWVESEEGKGSTFFFKFPKYHS